MSMVPTLNHLCLVQVAVLVCNSPEVKELGTTIVSCFTDNNDWEPLVLEKLSRYELPKVCQKNLIPFIKPICFEIIMWKTNHFEILGRDVHKPIHFCWDSMGTINHFETAKRLVHSQNFTAIQRFTMTCYYCMVNEAQRLWKKASAIEKEILIKSSAYKNRVYRSSLKKVHSQLIPGNQVLRFWINGLQQGSADETRYELFHCSLLWDRKMPVLGHMLQRLPSEETLNLLAGRIRRNNRINSNERIYLSNLNVEQKKEFLKREAFEVLRMYLQWPLQSQFLKMADSLWVYITERNFLELLLFILDEKIEKKWEDFNYVNLLLEFWSRSPNRFKEYVEQSPFSSRFETYICE
ncbi:uncharacterized protein NPIL_647901 [Nephila pilipes]|uniref:Uncharacterized protein n=1 Tax=Nephila pilipes TaxID=299642 RepID=A0A8X6TUU1_NEPPI|nr:uncharacterized protein NPIL_647901 [Nephila pilipes]